MEIWMRYFVDFLTLPNQISRYKIKCIITMVEALQCILRPCPQYNA